MAKPWMTTNDLISTIKRKIMMPVYQQTFSEQDIIDFLNEELMISQVPAVMSFHEEYFVVTKEIPIEANKSRYPIPDRAIGMKLRDIFYKDTSGAIGDMVRVAPEDKAFWQNGVNNEAVYRQYYIENNDIVLLSKVGSNPVGTLLFEYFLRPNQLVPDNQAAIISYFTKDVTIVNASIVAGDTITIKDIVFTAVAGAPSTNEFQIGATSVITATNLAAAINTNGVVTASNGSPSTDTINLKFISLSDSQAMLVSNINGIVISPLQGVQFSSIPSTISNNSQIDFLQTKPGHKTRGMDVTISNNSISGSIITFSEDDVPSDLVIGDYICPINECIIPQIPPDLHVALAERASARILSALGDQAGLQAVNQKISEIEVRQGTLLDNRIEGSPQKVSSKNSLMRFLKSGWYRRI